jgi:hypothetical protein
MQTEIVVALITLGGSAIGTFGGILASSKLTAYRIEQLEKKVDKHNSFAERIPVLENRLKVEEHRMDDAEEDIRKTNEKILNMNRRNSI